MTMSKLSVIKRHDNDGQLPASETIHDAFLRLIWATLWYGDRSKATQAELCAKYNLSLPTFNLWLHDKKQSKTCRAAVLSFVNVNHVRLRLLSTELYEILIDTPTEEKQEVIDLSKDLSDPSCRFDFLRSCCVPWQDWRFIWSKYNTFEGVKLNDVEAVSSAVMSARIRRSKRDEKLLPVWDVLKLYVLKYPIPVALLFKGRPEIAKRVGNLK